MCLLIIEILFFISGVLLLFTGKVPQQLFGVMFGKGVYEIAPLQARLFGTLFTIQLLQNLIIHPDTIQQAARVFRPGPHVLLSAPLQTESAAIRPIQVQLNPGLR